MPGTEGDNRDSPNQFSHAKLEKVIYGRTPLREILGHEPQAMGGYVVADFVGSHQIDQERFAAGDLIQASARIFFEDSGAFVTSFEGEAYGKNFNLVLFATFVVLEIAPYTPHARFVVLSPAPEEDAVAGPYAGLVRSHNTDALRERLEAAPDLSRLLLDMETLLERLAEDPRQRTERMSLWRRLFGRQR